MKSRISLKCPSDLCGYLGKNLYTKWYIFSRHILTLIYQRFYFLKLCNNPLSYLINNLRKDIFDGYILMFEFPTWNSNIEWTLLKILSISKRRTTVKVSSWSILWNRIFERFFNQIFSSTSTKFSITQPKLHIQSTINTQN